MHDAAGQPNTHRFNAREASVSGRSRDTRATARRPPYPRISRAVVLLTHARWGISLAPELYRITTRYAVLPQISLAQGSPHTHTSGGIMGDDQAAALLFYFRLYARGGR